MLSFARASLAAVPLLFAACAHEPSIDVASPIPRLAGARLYVLHESGYRSATWGSKPDSSTLYFATSAAPAIPIEWCSRMQSCYPALDNARLAAVIADDGHAAAISLDDGATWRNVALDGRLPFLCRHHAATSPAELWSKLPTTRALAVEIFRDPGSHADSTLTRWNATTTNFQAELAGALDYATIANDEPLWIEIARGYATPAPLFDFIGDDRTLLVARLHRVAEERPAVRAVFAAATASEDANVRKRIAEVLASDEADGR